MHRRTRLCALWCVAALSVGCYKHHLGEASDSDAMAPRDASFDASVDAHADASRDGSDDAPHDAQLDAESDAHVDADVDAEVDAGLHRYCRVPTDYPTLQAALDDSTCDPIIVVEPQLVSTVTIARDVTITALSTLQSVVISGDGSGSVVIVEGNRRVTLERLEIRNGVADVLGGGGIRSTGRLTLRDTYVSANRVEPTARGNGGGLHQTGGSLRIEGRVIFEANQVGALDQPAAFGGGMFIDSDVTIDGQLLIYGNLVEGERAAGGGIYIYGGTLRGSGLYMQDNTAIAHCRQGHGFAQASGGGIGGTGIVELTNPGFESNSVEAIGMGACSAIASGGALAVDASIVGGYARSNHVLAQAEREAPVVVYAQGGFLSGNAVIDGMEIRGNGVTAIGVGESVVVGQGGAIQCMSCQIQDTRVTSNNLGVGVSGPRAPAAATYPVPPPLGALGGGIWAQHLELTDSLISENRASLTISQDREGTTELVAGGGLALMANALDEGEDFVIVRSSIVDNSARTSGGANQILANGGGIFVEEGASQALIVASTISGNAARANHRDDFAVTGVACGGGLGVAGDQRPERAAVVALYNVTIANNIVTGADAQAPGICRPQHPNDAPVTLHNSVLWNNRIGEDLLACSAGCVGGTYNIVDPMCSAGLDGTNRTTDPGLSDLIELSERCHAHEITRSSAARNAGNTGACAAPLGIANDVDQCGRPRSGNCDIGAVEAR